MRCLIVSGQSGSGKSVALHTLEDAGYYCIDNLPVELLPDLIEKLASRPIQSKIAVGVDARSSDEEGMKALPAILQQLRDNGIKVEVLFLQTDLDTLVRRFNETRRRHPLTTDEIPLVQAINLERQRLEPISMSADVFIDTTNSNLHQLRQQIHDRLIDDDADGMSMLFQSFGYKHGTPLDTDFAFDIRCLPNPHWEVSLRPMTGRDEPIIKFLEEHASVEEMYRSISDFLTRFVPQFEAENRAYLTISIGCTGGRHRSVYMSERLAELFRQTGRSVSVRHRELD